GAPPLVVVFDGQVYNLPQLRRDLHSKLKSYPPVTAPVSPPIDETCQIVACLYEQLGPQCPSRLRGPFAFALWDLRRGYLLLARDRFGIKPLYYARAGGTLIFASEAKAVLAHPLVTPALNLCALPHYLTFQYFPGEESAFKNVFRLPPATCLEARDPSPAQNQGQGPGLHITTTRYWQLKFNPHPDRHLSYYVDFTGRLLKESVRLHADTGLPLGAFLSSGVDSSLIAAMLTVDRGQARTFSVNCAGGRYNELPPAKETALLLRSIHRELEIDSAMFWEALPRAIWYQDEPVADPSAIALFLACRLAAGEIKVVLSGEGADELFGGYTIYRQPASLAPLQALPRPLKQAIKQIALALPEGVKGKNFLLSGITPLERRYFGNALIFSEEEKKQLLNRELFPGGWPPPWEATAPYYRRSRRLDGLTRMQYLDFFTWLPGDILAKADRMAAACSIELRTPFLDHRLVEMAAGIPSCYKIRKGITKYVLRQAASQYLLPEISFRPKLGFPVPTGLWIGRHFANEIRELFRTSPAACYFNSSYLTGMLDRHLQGGADYGRKLWTIAVFMLWHRLYLEKGDTNFPPLP
ncbi:MAG TPA: asparagine synthase (glutamine-hydrolyzing), partial [Firmicutes bacterium]|nr:asparagine synthase (glutamine-hydrolyzing) [Bacillota bacterium]